jgi:hypothetical protein
MSKNNAFATITGLGVNTNNTMPNNIINNFRPSDNDLSNPNLLGYDILNKFDQDTLNRMSSNNFEPSNTSARANKTYETRQIPQFSNFVSEREPSLNVGMSALPIQNMTILPNQLQNSLDLLAQTDQLTISSYNKNSDILSKSNIVSSNIIDDPISKFQGIATPHIPYDEHQKPTAYFDNFTNTGRTDIIREYVCHINSIDRDIRAFKNPFNFLVKCAPLAGDPNAAISRTFSNIRYIKIEAAVLPRKYYISKTMLQTPHNKIIELLQTNALPNDNQIIPDTPNNWVIIHSFDKSTKNPDGTLRFINKTICYTEFNNDQFAPMNTSYECNLSCDITVANPIPTFTTYFFQMTNLSLENDKYSIIYLNDINDVSHFSTDIALSKAFNVLYPDYVSGDSLYIDSKYVDKIFKFSELGNLNRLLIRMASSLGKDLTVNINALDYNLSNLDTTACTCSTDQFGNIKRDYKCICSYLRHPRFIKSQVDFMFKFGIVETDFDKRVFN